MKAMNDTTQPPSPEKKTTTRPIRNPLAQVAWDLGWGRDEKPSTVDEYQVGLVPKSKTREVPPANPSSPSAPGPDNAIHHSIFKKPQVFLPPRKNPIGPVDPEIERQAQELM